MGFVLEGTVLVALLLEVFVIEVSVVKPVALVPVGVALRVGDVVFAPLITNKVIHPTAQSKGTR